MPLVIFTANPKLPRDMAHLPYVAGYSAEMSADQADRWIRRGVARIVVPAPAPVVEAVPEPAEDDGPVLVRASEIDPETATEDEMRAWLTDRGTPPHHRTGEARLRELVMEALTA